MVIDRTSTYDREYGGIPNPWVPDSSDLEQEDQEGPEA
jgi:hypothetical protein